MCMSSPSYPTPVPLPPTPAPTPVPQLPDQSTATIGSDARTRALGAVSADGTILTGPEGLTTSSSPSEKTLLGS